MRVLLLLPVLVACTPASPGWEVTFRVDLNGKAYRGLATLPPDLEETRGFGGVFGTEFERRGGVTHTALDSVQFALEEEQGGMRSNAEITRRRVGQARVEDHRFGSGSYFLVWSESAGPLWKTCYAKIGSIGGSEASERDVREAERVCASYRVDPELLPPEE